MKNISKLKRRIAKQSKYIVYAVDRNKQKHYVCYDLTNIRINHMLQGESYLTEDRSKAFKYPSKGIAENVCKKFWGRSVNIPTEVRQYHAIKNIG